MTIELTERLLGIWFVECDEKTDWLGSLERDEEKGGVIFTYRFRYYVDDKSFDSKDRKNWTSFHIGGESGEKAVDVVRKLCVHLSTVDDGKIYECLMGDGGMDEFMEKFEQMPFAKVKKLTREEAIAEGYEVPDGPED